MTGAAAVTPPLLEIEGLTASYGPVRALHGVDLDVAEGRVVAILGPNGAGKTTTLRAVCGMVRAQGRVTYRGRDILGMPAEKVVRLGVAHVPEGRGTFNDLTVAENLRLGAYARQDKDVQADLDRWYGVFPRLAERREQKAGSLSGGEQQMLAIARAVLSRPSLLLLDEPSLGLAPRVTRELFDVLADVKTTGTSMVLVEQNAALALELADTAYVLEAGRTVLSGPATDLRGNDAVRRSYLGY